MSGRKLGVLLFFTVVVVTSLCAGAQDSVPALSDGGILMGSRESCRQTHTFDASKAKVWEALTYAWDDLGLPSLPDQPGDLFDEGAGRLHATLHPGVSGYSWGPETTCCDVLVVDAAVTGDRDRTRLDLRLAVGYTISDCCDLDMPGYELEQVFFDAVLKRLPAPYDPVDAEGADPGP